MSVSLIPSVVSLPQSPFPPLAVGFMGLGTGYLIYGIQELFGYPARDDRVDFATGMWGIWMPGFMQFIAGVYLFLGLTLFGTFRTPAAMPRWVACSSAWSACMPSTSSRVSSLTCRSSAAWRSGQWASSVSVRDSGLCIWYLPWR
jgi:hypothetical protein